MRLLRTSDGWLGLSGGARGGQLDISRCSGLWLYLIATK
jgi:hypothetical protein